MYEKLSRLSFDKISTCIDMFSTNLLQNLNEWIEKGIVLKENETTYLPYEIKSSLEISFNSQALIVLMKIMDFNGLHKEARKT